MGYIIIIILQCNPLTMYLRTLSCSMSCVFRSLVGLGTFPRTFQFIFKVQIFLHSHTFRGNDLCNNKVTTYKYTQQPTTLHVRSAGPYQSPELPLDPTHNRRQNSFWVKWYLFVLPSSSSSLVFGQRRVFMAFYWHLHLHGCCHRAFTGSWPVFISGH